MKPFPNSSLTLDPCLALPPQPLLPMTIILAHHQPHTPPTPDHTMAHSPAVAHLPQMLLTPFFAFRPRTGNIQAHSGKPALGLEDGSSSDVFLPSQSLPHLVITVSLSVSPRECKLYFLEISTTYQKSIPCAPITGT